MKLFFIATITAATLGIPFLSNAAILYISPESSQKNIGDTFIQSIRMNTEGEFINIADIKISFPENILTFQDFSKGDSILSLWLDEPAVKNGVISFSGGVPAGFQGSDGLLGRIVFRVNSKASKQADESGNITANLTFLEDSKVFLNDGKGTTGAASFKNAIIAVNSQLSQTIQNEWEQHVKLDGTSPEPFTIEISQESSVFDGKYFITFSTVDKQTGVDHYEVLEYFDGKTYENKNAQSPYLLQNQDLGGIIRVSAVDERGNVAIAEIRPPASQEQNDFPWREIIGAAAVLGLITAGFAAWKMILNKYQIKGYQK